MRVTASCGPAAGRTDLATVAVATTRPARPAPRPWTSLGLPVPASRSVARITDTARGQSVDEVTDLDPGGKPLAITRFDLSGNLVSSVRLGYVAPAGSALTPSLAQAGAATIATNLGVPVGAARRSVRPGQPGAGWSAGCA